jgi:hypothetical protein
MILIHTALLCEAQTFIEVLKLKKINSTPKIYTNDKYLVLIAGVGADNTSNSLEYIFQNYKITKAINIGVAGVSNRDIKIGELFCCNKKLDTIKWLPLKTVDTPKVEKESNENSLYDMEGKYFLDICLNNLDENNIFIFKIISDYLNDEILPKDFIKRLIKDASPPIFDNFI